MIYGSDLAVSALSQQKLWGPCTLNCPGLQVSFLSGSLIGVRMC